MTWGTASRNDTNTSLPKIEEKTNQFALNFQAMGDIKSLPTSFFITYASAKKGTIFAQTPNDVTAATIVGEIAPIKHILMLSTGYRIADNGENTNANDNANLFSVKYFYKENVQCQLNYVRNENNLKRDEVYLIFRTVF